MKRRFCNEFQAVAAKVDPYKRGEIRQCVHVNEREFVGRYRHSVQEGAVGKERGRQHGDAVAVHRDRLQAFVVAERA